MRPYQQYGILLTDIKTIHVGDLWNGNGSCYAPLCISGVIRPKIKQIALDSNLTTI